MVQWTETSRKIVFTFLQCYWNTKDHPNLSNTLIPLEISYKCCYGSLYIYVKRFNYKCDLVNYWYKSIFEAEILSLCDSYSLANREFYFDRSPRIFENILGLYRKGELHLTESVCPRDFLGTFILFIFSHQIQMYLRADFLALEREVKCENTHNTV